MLLNHIVGRKETWLRHITARFLRAARTKITSSPFFPSLSYHTSLEPFWKEIFTLLICYISFLQGWHKRCDIVTALYLAFTSRGTARQGSSTKKFLLIHFFPRCLAWLKNRWSTAGSQAGVWIVTLCSKICTCFIFLTHIFYHKSVGRRVPDK